ncbi:MAG: MATE family efflux transporter [Pseudomonadota bacterium]
MVKPEVARETGNLWRLALPLMGAQMAQMGMGVVDAVMAGQYSSTDLAGVALGGSIFWPIMLLMMGLLQAITPTVSQLHGAGKIEQTGEVIRQGLWLALAGGAVAFVILHQIGVVYDWVGVDPNAAPISVAYLKYCAYGLPALLCFLCLRFLSDGIGFTRPALLISVSALLLKIPLNYLFIYGGSGIPAMGGVGAGVAQAIIMWWQLAMILFVVTRKRFHATGWRSQFSWPNWLHIKPLLVIGIPIGATIFAEVGLFSMTTLLLGKFGAETVAAHNIAMNVNGLLFMPAMALGMAGTIRIGFRVGAGEINQARGTASIAMVSSILVALTGCLLIFLFRHDIVLQYTSEPNVAELASALLLMVVFFLTFDAAQATAAGALRGYKDTRTPMWIALFSYWVVGLPLECILGFGWIGEPMGLYGFWIGLAVGVGTAALLLGTRLYLTSRNTERIQAFARLSQTSA